MGIDGVTIDSGPDRARTGKTVAAWRFGAILALLSAALLVGACATDARPGPTPAQKSAAGTPGVVPTASPAAKAAASPAAQAGASPVAKPSPAAKPAAAPAPADPGWNWINNFISITMLLTILGVFLLTTALVSWYLSNQQDRRPRAAQLAEMKRFVEEDFARFVASGLESTGQDGGSPIISKDKDWRKLFVHQIHHHSELYQFSLKAALEVYDAHIDEAVKRELERRRGSETTDDRRPTTQRV